MTRNATLESRRFTTPDDTFAARLQRLAPAWGRAGALAGVATLMVACGGGGGGGGASETTAISPTK